MPDEKGLQLGAKDVIMLASTSSLLMNLRLGSWVNVDGKNKFYESTLIPGAPGQWTLQHNNIPTEVMKLANTVAESLDKGGVAVRLVALDPSFKTNKQAGVKRPSFNSRFRHIEVEYFNENGAKKKLSLYREEFVDAGHNCRQFWSLSKECFRAVDEKLSCSAPGCDQPGMPGWFLLCKDHADELVDCAKCGRSEAKVKMIRTSPKARRYFCLECSPRCTTCMGRPIAEKGILVGISLSKSGALLCEKCTTVYLWCEACNQAVGKGLVHKHKDHELCPSCFKSELMTVLGPEMQYPPPFTGKEAEDLVALIDKAVKQGKEEPQTVAVEVIGPGFSEVLGQPILSNRIRKMIGLKDRPELDILVNARFYPRVIKLIRSDESATGLIVRPCSESWLAMSRKSRKVDGLIQKIWNLIHAADIDNQFHNRVVAYEMKSGRKFSARFLGEKRRRRAEATILQEVNARISADTEARMAEPGWEANVLAGPPPTYRIALPSPIHPPTETQF